jgi:hypothetical protein
LLTPQKKGSGPFPPRIRLIGFNANMQAKFARGIGAASDMDLIRTKRLSQTVFATPQKKGSGPLTTPDTFLRHAW